ncbi:MAG: FG-GAP-like repeat-containing protein, partial [Candidatus Symbiothrix sp.]|nr:FG-GAP-like repeat-containing protein [Candidatus Symbiothrix sp.]
MKQTYLLNTKEDEKGIAGQARNDRPFRMKQYIILFIFLNVFWCGYSQYNMYNPVNLGTKNAPFSHTGSYNTTSTSYSNNIELSTKEIWHSFTLSKAMQITVSHCNSGITATCYLLDNNYNSLAFADNEDWGTSDCGNGYMRKLLLPGTYYVASEGYSQDGNITVTISGQEAVDPVSYINYVGTKSANFTYTDNQNTNNSVNYYVGNNTRDLIYQFTLTKTMDVTISHCGSAISDTYLHLLDASGTRIDYNDNYAGTGHCSNTSHAYLKKQLSIGTYYVVSEGKTLNGNITTKIEGTALSAPVTNIGTKSANFTYSNTQNTTNTANFYVGRSTNDVFYKFTLSNKMTVTMSHSGTSIDTYIYLLDASENHIASNSDYSSITSDYSFLQKTLEAGTYYVVSEGYSQNGSITTHISGTLVSNEFNYPLSPNADSAEPEAVGSIPGQFDVSPTGAATFSIPIAVPPGVGGMQPSLAIVYNSQTGNGVAGWGCNLSGTSAITRTPKSKHYDAAAKGLTHLADEGYVLDGQRLILSSGTPGTDGAIYYPESDPFTKVVVHGTYNTSTANTWFEVLTKDGMKYYYGNTTGARQSYSAGSAPRINAWYLDYVEDALRNYMDYTYTKSDYFMYLNSITYGKNKNETTSLQNTLSFTYATRTDQSPFVIEGVKGNLTKRLSGITCKTGTAVYREYVLGYNTTSDAFSRLTTVTEKNGAGESLKPVRLNWNYLPTVAYSNQTPVLTGSLSNFGDQFFSSADLNGDGISDIISFTPNYNNKTLSQHLISTKQSDGSYKFVATNPRYLPPNIKIKEIHHEQGLAGHIAFNALGDGKQYLLAPFYLSNNSGPRIHFYLYGLDGQANSNVIEPNETYVTVTKEELPVYTTGDVYNKGKDAIVFVENNVSYPNYVCQGKVVELDSIKSNQMPIYSWINFTVSTPKPGKMFLSDFNGDGMNDILIFCNSGYTILWNQGGSTPYSDSNKTTGTNIGNVWKIAPGDFNGDGLTDFIMNSTGDSNWYFALNNGNGTFTKQLACTLAIYDQDFTDRDDPKFNVQVFDFDFDGKSDVIITKAMYTKKQEKILGIVVSTWGEFNKTYTYWMRSTGTALSLHKSATSNKDEDASSAFFITGDFNGDGQPELLNYGYDCYNAINSNINAQWRLNRNPGFNANTGKVTSIISGTGGTTNILYASLANDTIYTKGTGSVYPVMDCTIPISAVKNVSFDSGTDNPVSVNYKYAGAKIHLTGKGFLGMMSQTVTNNTTGVKTESGIQLLNLTYFVPEKTYNKTTTGNKTAQSTVNLAFTGYGTTKKYFARPEIKTEINLDGDTTTAIYQFNTTYGNITEEKTRFGSNDSMYVKVQYANYIQAGGTMPNKPQLITTIRKHADDYSTFTQKTAFTYNATKGYPTQKIENYGSSKAVTTAFTYDNFGNVLTQTVSATGVSPVTSYNQYDATKRFVTKQYTAPSSTISSYGYDTWGNVIVEKDSTLVSNILTTSHVYNGWGQKTSTTLPDGNKIAYSSGWNNNLPAKRYFTITQANGQPWVKTWYDRLGRETGVETTGPKGINIVSTNVYNNKGQLTQKQSQQGNLSITETYTYDNRGRVVSKSSTNGQSVTYRYGIRIDTITTNNRNYIKTYDRWGGIKTSKDPATTVSYIYKSMGKPKTINASNAVFSMEYDSIGNQTKLIDPNAGTTVYTYDALSRLKTQT